MYVKHRLESIFVENNGIQDVIVEQVKTVQSDRSDIKVVELPVKGYHTGSQKFNPDLGLPALDIQFQNKQWIICKPGKHEDDCKCFFCVMYKEFKFYPFYNTTDVVMSVWFAERALMDGAKINVGSI